MSTSRPNGRTVFPFEFVNCRLAPVWLGASVPCSAGERDVEAEMMPAELNHPGLGGGRLSEKGNEIVVASEIGPAATSAFRPPAPPPAARSTWAAGPASSTTRSTATAAVTTFQHFVGLNDLQNFFIALLG